MSRAEPRKRHHRTTFAAHLFVVGLVVANATWILTDTVKRAVVDRIHSPFLEWAALFHHADEAALLPYVATALVAFAYGLALYVGLRRPAFRAVRRLARAACSRSVPLLALILALQAVLSAPGLHPWLRAALAVVSLVACLVRRPGWVHGAARAVGLRVSALVGGVMRTRAPLVPLVCGAATAALLVSLAVEPVKIAIRPIRLLNEYRHLPQRELVAGAAAPGGAADRHCRLACESPTEFFLQSASRGQINHIGHVLNPINEWETGKAPESTYFQYGIGATFVFKWIMDLLGGPSIHTYYATLLGYVAYWLVFAGAVLFVFRDVRYLLAAVGLLAASYYTLGYDALVIAPGVNPLLHFLDLPVLAAALAFFRGGRTVPLVAGALGAAAAFALNALFGTMVIAAFLVSASFHALETAPEGRRVRRLAGLLALVAVPLAAIAWLQPSTSGSGVTAQFLLGFLSWRPRSLLVFLTLAYLAGSYLFLLWARERRDPVKYAVVYLFVYAQGFLLYFYWSGLNNHFWPALPYVGLHLLLMLRVLGESGRLGHWEPRLLLAALAGIALLLKTGIDGFVKERFLFRKPFARGSHAWTFPRATVVSTGDPAPIAESLAQIERYSSPGDRRVAIVSVFDNLLPFLAGRHSVFSHFDLQWALITAEERARAVEALRSARPAYVFVGREVEGDVADPRDVCCGVDTTDELESARGRIGEMARVFAAVADDYERIETGPLLSVYRRKDAASSTF